MNRLHAFGWQTGKFSLFVKPVCGLFFVSAAEPPRSCPAARGGDASRDAMRRTGRDDVSRPDATLRIMVAKQPASTPSAFVVARSAQRAARHSHLSLPCHIGG